MSDETADSDGAKKGASSEDSKGREDADEVPEYRGQWAALSDGDSQDEGEDSETGSSDGA
jgi:hypothetical protein